MTSEVSDIITGLLEDTDEHIEVADGHHITAKQKKQVRMKMCDDKEILSSQRCTTYFWH